MGSLVKASLWVWMIVDAAAFSASLPEITDEKFVEECVREHNRARSTVKPTARDMLYMVGQINISFTSCQMMSAKTKRGRKKTSILQPCSMWWRKKNDDCINLLLVQHQCWWIHCASFSGLVKYFCNSQYKFVGICNLFLVKDSIITFESIAVQVVQMNKFCNMTVLFGPCMLL